MPDKNPTRQANLNAAAGQASKRLKEAHTDEWNKYMIEETTARKEKWAPKMTEEQKAQAELEKLLRTYPALAAQYGIVEDPTPPEPKDESTFDDGNRQVK